MSSLKRSARLLEAAAVLSLVLVAAGVALPAVSRSRSRARETETKSNLNAIQLGVERYSVDHEATYPRYLIGGEARCSATVDPAAADGRQFRGVQNCDVRNVSDPLLMAGYLVAYPQNPFVKNVFAIHEAQLNAPLDAPAGDPLRNGTKSGQLYGTRFGPTCTSTGQLLAPRNYVLQTPAFANAPADAGTIISDWARGLPPGADIRYPCWAVWHSGKLRQILPGQFIYTGLDLGVSADCGRRHSNPDAPLPPPYNSVSYIMACFGAMRTKGADILDEQGNVVNVGLETQENGGGLIYGFGSPDSIPDGLILVRESGVEYAEDGY
jgi:type II secretory pathway pseudopilin PulG